jgi:hypothetical protein
LLLLINAAILNNTSRYYDPSYASPYGYYQYSYSVRGGYRTDHAQENLAYVLIGASVLIIGVGCFYALKWLYNAWRFLGPLLGKYQHKSPQFAIGMLFVPLYNVYWIPTFAMTVSHALRRLVQNRGNKMVNTRVLLRVGLLCGIFFIIPFLNVLMLMTLFPWWLTLANRYVHWEPAVE